MAPEKLSRHDVISRFRTHEIVGAAIELVKHDGIEHLTMGRVAAAAGVAKGTIYLYFKDKESLISATLHSLMDLMVERVSTAADIDGGLRARLLRVADALSELAEEYYEFFVYVHSPQHASDGDGCEATPQRMPLFEIIAEIFRDALRAGEIRETDPELLGLLFLKSVDAVLIRDAFGRKRVDPGNAEFLVDLLLNGIAKGKGSV